MNTMQAGAATPRSRFARGARAFLVGGFLFGLAATMAPLARAASAPDIQLYLLGARADYEVSLTRVLFHQAERAEVDAGAAAANAALIQSVAAEIQASLVGLEKALPEADQKLAGRHLVEMRALVTKSAEIARRLHDQWTAEAETETDTHADIGAETRELYRTVDAMRKAHGQIMTKLELPALDDPSASGS